MRSYKTTLFSTALFFISVAMYYATQLYLIFAQDRFDSVIEAPKHYFIKHLPIAVFVALVVAYVFGNVQVLRPLKTRVHLVLPKRYSALFYASLIASGWFLIASASLALLSRRWPDTFSSSVETTAHGIFSIHLLLSILIIGMLGPLLEEFFFRGLLMRRLSINVSITKAVIIQAVLFGVFHLNFTQGINTFFIGLYLGVMLVWTQSLWVPIMAHAMNNILSIVFAPTLFIMVDSYSAFTVVIATIPFGMVLITIGLSCLYKNRIEWIQLKCDKADGLRGKPCILP